MSVLKNNIDDIVDCNFYECQKISYSCPENTIILSKPNKTLLCTQTIILDKPEWDSPNILKFYTILCLLIDTSKIPIIYTTTIEKVSNGISSGEIDIDEFICSNYIYISHKIELISIDKEKKYITFNKNDIAIIKIYGSSVTHEEQNKMIISPKLLEPVFGN
jgi:hypothetical protein